MKPKGRPKKYCVVNQLPGILKFSPRGKPGRPDEISLKMEEFEALRLSDDLGIKQKEAARLMKVSQQTFSRILKRARKSLSNAIIHGKIVKIEGGKYILIADKHKKNPIRD